MNVNDHDRFRADVRQRLAHLGGAQDSEEIADDIAAEIVDRPHQRRSKRETSRVLEILDQLDREGNIR